MNKFLENLAALLKVKTIVTLMLTIIFCVLALTGVISGADFLTVFTVVIAFYFGTQQAKATANDQIPVGYLFNDTLPQTEETATETVAPEAAMDSIKPPENE